MAISRKELRDKLLDYANASADDRWGEIEVRLRPQTVIATAQNKRRALFAAYGAYLTGLAVFVAVMAAFAVCGPAFFHNLNSSQTPGWGAESFAAAGTNSSAAVPENKPASSAVTQSSEGKNTAAKSLQSSAARSPAAYSSAVSVSKSPVVGGVCEYIYYLYNGEFYKTTCVRADASSTTNTVGEKLGEWKNGFFYRINGTDPSRSIYVYINDVYWKFDAAFPDHFTFNGVSYQIPNASRYSGTRGAQIGTVDGHALYGVTGESQSKHIFFQANGGLYTDAYAK